MLRLLQDVAAEVVDPRFRALGKDEVSSKRRPGDLVTVADREAEVLITAALRRGYPGALVLGEEAVAADPRCSRAGPRPSTRSPSTRSTAPATSSRAPPTTP